MHLASKTASPFENALILTEITFTNYIKMLRLKSQTPKS